MPAPHPRIHGAVHVHGGPDPIQIAYESTDEGGSSGALMFDTYPQDGQWLYIETDGTDTSPSGFGVEVFDDSGNGINLGASSGGQILLKATGGGDIVIQSTGGAIRLTTAPIVMQALPTTDPGSPGALWVDSSGFLKVSL